VAEVGLEQLLESREVTQGHSLDKEVAVMAKEEKTSTLAHAFACFEDLVDVGFNFRAETFLNVEYSESILVPKMCKYIWSKLCANDVLVDNIKLLLNQGLFNTFSFRLPSKHHTSYLN